MHLVQSNW